MRNAYLLFSLVCKNSRKSPNSGWFGEQIAQLVFLFVPILGHKKDLKTGWYLE
jgi:hypothetical protein